MAMITDDELRTLRDARRSGLESLRTSVANLEQSLSALQEALADGPAETSTAGVTVAVDDDDVLCAVDFDMSVAEEWDGTQLLTRLSTVFATVPIPKMILSSLTADEERMRTVRGGTTAIRPQRIESARIPITLETVLGRPLAVHADPDSVSASEELAEEIVLLARRAVRAEEGDAA